MTQQAGLGLGVCGDGKGWSGGATRSDGEANQPQKIKEKRPKVFLEIAISNRKLGRIVIECFGDVVPKTVENFRALCTGEKGVSAVNGKKLCYKGSKFHRIIPSKIIQGGDISKGDGSGGMSIYAQDSDGTFGDENFKLKHDRPGLISMAHKGGERGVNCSQFFFTTKANPKFDGVHCCFGRVIQGMDLISKVESAGTQSGRPLFDVVIDDCGELESAAMELRKRKKPEAEDKLPTGWEKKESRSKPGLFYYVHEGGYTQFEPPTSRGRDPLTAMADIAKRRRVEAEARGEKPKDLLAAGHEEVRACNSGEIRVWHIVKKHRDFFGKPATSWRQKSITWSKDEAKAVLEKLRWKLINIGYGGGDQAMQRKFENLARLESDDDHTAKVGGDLGPVTKRKQLFGGQDFIQAAFKLKQGEVSEVTATSLGVHLIARFE